MDKTIRYFTPRFARELEFDKMETIMNFWQRWFPLTSLLCQKRQLSLQNEKQTVNGKIYLTWKQDLIASIIENDVERVRQLIQNRPISRPDNRLYGVIVENEGSQVELIVVRNDGTRLATDDMIESDVGVDVLNLVSE